MILTTRRKGNDMTEDTTQHVLEDVEAYLGGGLSPDERATVKTHLAECETCRQALAEARDVDDELREAFDGTAPDEGFEDQIIRRVRAERGPRRRLVHPRVWRSAGAIAAAVLLTGTGVVVTNVLNGMREENNRTKVASNLRQIGSAMVMSSDPDVLQGGANQQTLRAAAAFRNSKGPSSGASYDQFDSVNYPEFSRGAGTALSSLSDIGRARVDNVLALQKTQDLTASVFKASEHALTVGSDGKATAGAGESALTTNGGTTLDLNGANTTRGLVPIGGGSSTYYFQPSQLGTSSNVAALNTTGSVDGLAKAGSGTLTLGGSSTYGGGTTINGGTLTIANGDSPPNIYNSTLTITPTDGANAIALASAQGKGGAATNGAGANPTTPAPQALPASGRKVIRNGTMEFEVDRFDDALVRVTKLVIEQQGFVATTDSDKLANGKMKGTITLRVPPERMDTLVLSLRALGDLKGQKITAEDVTKHYTDLESELRADRAMEDRLLEIIKTGAGGIKDLLAAEKELAVWREKIEQIEGEKRYLDSQVSLSTLVLTLIEKDIKLPANASETEQVNMSLETEKVDEAYDSALEAIKTGKGRILQSELKQYDAGQFGATIMAAIPPDASEQVIARLRQLGGRIAHFDREHKQAMQDGGVVRADVLHVQREDSIVNLQIYNLANIAPRRTIGIRVAVADVDKTFHNIIDQVRSLGGRVVTSSLAKPDANSQTAELDLQVPVEKADILRDALTGSGEVMRQESTENPDTANVTEAKRGFRVSLAALTATTPRESQIVQLAAGNVPQAFDGILDAVRAGGGRVLQSDLSEQNPQDVNGTLVFEISRMAFPQVSAAIDKAAQVLSRTINRSANIENTVDTKLRLQMSLMSAERLNARQTTTIREEVADVERSVDDVVNAAVAAGGRRLAAGDMTQDRSGHVTAQVILEVPLNKAGPVLDQIERSGNRRSKQVAFDTSVPEGSLARARIDVTFSNSASSLGGEETTGDAIRNGLSVSGKGLRWSLQMLVVGFCFVAPWVFVLWMIGKLVRRSRATKGEKSAAA